jgi:hypothetical protein
MWEPAQTPGPGFVVAFGTCAACHKAISFNPHYVPSIRVNGVREPVCKACIDAANPARIANGLEPFTVHPNAYAPLPADEL